MNINPLQRSPMRMTGMSSGMDIDLMVRAMMASQQTRLNRELRAQKLMQWRQESLTSIRNDLRDFRSTYMSVLSPKNLLSANAYADFVVTTNDTGGHVTISANGQASAGSFTINSITQLATTTKAVSQNKVSSGTELSPTNDTMLKDLSFAHSGIHFVNGKASLQINGVDFTFNETDTLGSVMNTINNSNAGVTMSYSRVTDRFTLQAKQSGAGQALTFGDTSGNLLNSFGLELANVEDGVNAKFKIDGVEAENAANTFTIDGITYNLHRTTVSESNPTGEVSINVTIKLDVAPALSRIKDFVGGYNTLVKKLQGMLTEKVDRKFYPLTDEEKSEMSEKDIADWEMKAKEGLMRSNPGVRALLDDMRSALYAAVEGAGLSPADIGLRTSMNWREGGTIELDEIALRNALEKDHESVMKVFTDLSSSADPATRKTENGLLYRIIDSFENYTREYQSVSIETLERSMRDKANTISRMEQKMFEQAEKLYKKYAAMETALSRLDSQMAWMQNTLSQLTNTGK